MPRAKGLYSERALSEYPPSGPEQTADEPLYGARKAAVAADQSASDQSKTPGNIPGSFFRGEPDA